MQEEKARRIIQEEIRVREEKERNQQKKEEADRNSFAILKKKYFVKNCIDDSPTSPLYMILLKLEEKEMIDRNDIDYLKNHQWYGPLAMYYENEYLKDQSDLWPLISACSIWRNAKLPNRSIDISSNAFTNEKKPMAALYTTRGGAFRDLSKFEDAKKCAETAINLQPSSYYPYNLMGAIFCQTGEPETADEYFEQAISLGSSPKDVDGEIEHSIKLSNEENQQRVVNYLLKKDPKRYEWANRYLTKK